MSNRSHHTLADVVEYIMANRRGKAFQHWTRSDITLALNDSLDDGAFLYSVDGKGNINGVCHGRKFVRNNVLFVFNILTTGRGVLNNFIERFKEMFPGYRLEGKRHDKIKIYNTDRFVSKLLPKG